MWTPRQESAMKELTASDKQVYEKIANMEIMGVMHTGIAGVLGVSEGLISQIVAKEEYQQIKGVLLATKYEDAEKGDSNWDKLERMAVDNLINTAGWNTDPDFLLRAAAVANRAQRRGRMTNNDPLPNQMGKRVVVNLSQVFVGKLQDINGDAHRVSFNGNGGTDQTENGFAVDLAHDGSTENKNETLNKVMQIASQTPKVVKENDRLSSAAIDQLFGKLQPMARPKNETEADREIEGIFSQLVVNV